MTETDPSAVLPRVSATGQVELDWDRPLRIAKRGPFYKLPKRGPLAAGSEWLLSIDPVAARATPLGGGSSAVNGGLLLLVLVILCADIFFAGLMLGAKGEHSAFVLYSILGPASFLFLVLAIAIFVRVMKGEYTTPLLLNRRDQTVSQAQKNSLVEANWAELVPYVEVVRTVNYSGGAQLHNLHLVLSEHGGEVKRILVKNALGGYSEALAYYEFLRRYMNGEWAGLPETYLIGGIRQSWFDEFRSNMWNAPFTRVPWRQSSTKRKWISSGLLIIFTILWWPVTMLTLVGARMGYIPMFPREVELRTTYNAAQDGPLPSELRGKIKLEERVAGAEKMLYLVAIAAGAIAWCWLGYCVISRM